MRTMSPQTACEESARRNEIIHLPWTPEAAAALESWCDESARDYPVHEFWGGSGPEEWRVHLDMRPAVEALRDEAGAAQDEHLQSACERVLDADRTGDWSGLRAVLGALDAAAAQVDLAEQAGR